MTDAAGIVNRVVESLNADGRQPPIPSDPSASLELADGNIDSLDLLDVIGGVEREASLAAGRTVTLTDSSGFDPEENPFASIGDLIAAVERAILTDA